VERREKCYQEETEGSERRGHDEPYAFKANQRFVIGIPLGSAVSRGDGVHLQEPKTQPWAVFLFSLCREPHF